MFTKKCYVKNITFNVCLIIDIKHFTFFTLKIKRIKFVFFFNETILWLKMFLKNNYPMIRIDLFCCYLIIYLKQN